MLISFTDEKIEAQNILSSHLISQVTCEGFQAYFSDIKDIYISWLGLVKDKIFKSA